MKAYVWFKGQEPVLLTISNRFRENGFDYGYCTYQRVTYEVCQSTTFNGRKDWNPIDPIERRNDVQSSEIETY